MNEKYLKKELSEINFELLVQVIEFVYTIGHNSFAPLGCSGNTYILYGSSRKKEISLRLHSGDVELLITDMVGNFLFYGKFDISLLPTSFIAKQYLSIIENVKHLLDNESKGNSISESDKQKMLECKILFSKLSIIDLF